MYLGNTFSPMMLSGKGLVALVEECDLDQIKGQTGLTSVVSHEVTASILSALLGREVAFNRVNLSLAHGDVLFCIVPSFRASEAREFSFEEVAAAGNRCFRVEVIQRAGSVLD